MKTNYPAKLFKLLLALSTLFILGTKSVQAVCPVCTIAVGAGLGISRALGVDDTVTSVWIGGLMLSSAFWFNDWLSKKQKLKKYANIWVLTILIFALFLLPLYLNKTIGVPLNTFLKIDKIVFGTAAGSIVFLLGVWLDKFQRQKFGNQFFNYQKVVFPFTMLLLASLVFFFITK